MDVLNLPAYPCKVVRRGGKDYVADLLRGRYVRLTREEWVRQHMVHYLVRHLAYPVGLMCVEQRVERWLRPDIVVRDGCSALVMLVECKAPCTELSCKVLEQMVRYNRFRVPYLVFSNGLRHFCFERGNEGGYGQRAAIPPFHEVRKRMIGDGTW